MKKIHLEYYAALREQTGKSKDTVQTQAGTIAELYAELQQTHRFSFGSEQLRAARNHQFCAWNTEIHDNDTVIFIPPVAGG